MSTERTKSPARAGRKASREITRKTKKNKAKELITPLALLRQHVGWFTLNLQDGFGMTPLEPDVLDRTAALWENLMGDASVESFMKWFYASCFSYITSQELPKFPGRQGLSDLQALRRACGVGRLLKFLRSLLHERRHAMTSGSRAEKRAAMVVASTIANMKKGSPVPSEAAVEASRMKHFAALTNRATCAEKKLDSRLSRDGKSHSRHEEWDAPLDERREDFDGALLDASLRSGLERSVDEVFSGLKFRDDSLDFPSTSGHFDSSRAKSGAARAIKPYLPQVWTEGWQRCSTQLHAMFFHPRAGVEECRVFAGIEDAFFEEFWNRKRSYDCKPSFILEPLKVRAVTAGPSFEYFACMSLQKFMWRALKSHPTFQLIGAPVTAEILNERLLPLQGGVDAKWMSGDYSAATDNLRQWISRCIFDRICRLAGVPGWLRRVGSKSLVGHKIHYQKGALRGVVATQWNGQLMGSPLSFPVLCLANAALCRLPFELSEWGESEDPRPLAELPVLVNGDDCVMSYTEKEKSWWERISAHAGMSPSVGKCYYSNQFLQINSENFLVEGDEAVTASKTRGMGPRLTRFIPVPYINFSLCNSTKSKGSEERTWADVGAAAREFIAGFPPTRQAQLMTVFLRRQRPLIDRAPKFCSWWLPECLGGLGLPWFPEAFRDGSLEDVNGPWPLDTFVPPDKIVSYRQRQMATYLRGRIEAGEAPLRRYSAAKVPVWVKLGMRAATSWEVPVKAPPATPADPIVEEDDGSVRYAPVWVTEWSEEDQLYHIVEKQVRQPRRPPRETEGNPYPYGGVLRTSGFGPFMWDSLAEATEDEFELESIEELACVRGWFDTWKKCLKKCAFARPASELLFYKPPEFVIPGGLSDFWSKVTRCSPRNLVRGLSSAYFVRSMTKGASPISEA